MSSNVPNSTIVTAVAAGVAAGVAATVITGLLQGRGGSHREDDGAKAALLAPKGTEFVDFSTEEAKQHALAESKIAKARTPAEVLHDLHKGNARYWTGNARRPETSIFHRRALTNCQFPSVAILSCADSRVAPELIFDKGVGDLFVIRVAGNILDMSSQGSLEYAIHHLQVKVVVVMGHECCGAVGAAGLPINKINQETEALKGLLKAIKAGRDDDRYANAQDPRARDREAVVTNVKNQVDTLSKDQSVMKRVKAGDLIVTGAFYELSSGIVDFFSQIDK